MGDSGKTDFGFETVAEGDKAARVRGVFDAVAPKYDLMNDLMSLGLHRAWKAYAVAVANLHPGDRVLDLAGGTGDLARAFARQVGASGLVLHTDINEAMLRHGGRVLVLEFSKVAAPLAKAYDWYSFNVLPRLGQWVAGDGDSYRYLAESIRVHPDQQTLAEMMTAAGLRRVRWFNLAAGVVALHEGVRF